MTSHLFHKHAAAPLRSLLFFSLFSLGAVLHAQMLLIEPGTDDADKLQFNPAFIARNSVASVSGQAWVKRDNKPMVPLDRHYLYRFNDTGRLGYSNNSFGRPGSGFDTASVMYSYTAEGRLIQELHNDLHGFYALRMQYDTEGRVEHMEHVRLENLGADRYHFTEGGATIVSDERYRHQALNDTIWMKTWLNDRGRPFQEELFTQDALGYLRQVDRRNLITQRRARVSFTYDEHGRLAERSEQPDLAIQHWSTWKWTYDPAGNPLTRDLYRDDIHVKHSEYLYADSTLFLKAVITRDEGTGVIDIIRYETRRHSALAEPLEPRTTD